MLNMVLNKNFRAFIALLNENDGRYWVVGGYAVNMHGYPRYTKDIDCWIEPANNNIQKLLSAITDFGFGSLGLQEEDFESPDNIIQLGCAPQRIDILTDVDGITFDGSFVRMKQNEIENTKINFLSIDDLIIAKKRQGDCKIGLMRSSLKK